MSILRYFITSKAKRKILKLFFEDTKYSFYTREIARLTGEPLNAVRRELSYLEKAGLLKPHMQGNQKYHEVNPDFPLLAEWRKIIMETPDAIATSTQTTPIRTKPVPVNDQAVESLNIKPTAIKSDKPPDIKPTAIKSVADIAHVLRAVFNDIESINMAVIHGNSAISEQIPAEGIDLLVVGDISKERLLELIVKFEESTRITIKLSSMSRSDFDYRNARGDPLIRRIWSEKKLVIKGRH